MNLPATIAVIRWLVRDTFRQARASGISALLLCVSAVCILVCLSVGSDGATSLHRSGERAEFLPSGDPEAARARAGHDGVDVVSGVLTLAFGAFRVPLGRDTEDAVRFLQMLLAGGVA